MNGLSSNKRIKVKELREWLDTANANDTISIEISPRWGSNIHAYLTEAEKVGRTIILKGFEK